MLVRAPVLQDRVLEAEAEVGDPVVRGVRQVDVGRAQPVDEDLEVVRDGEAALDVEDLRRLPVEELAAGEGVIDEGPPEVGRDEGVLADVRGRDRMDELPLVDAPIGDADSVAHLVPERHAVVLSDVVPGVTGPCRVVGAGLGGGGEREEEETGGGRHRAALGAFVHLSPWRGVDRRRRGAPR